MKRPPSRADGLHSGSPREISLGQLGRPQSLPPAVQCFCKAFKNRASLYLPKGEGLFTPESNPPLSLLGRMFQCRGIHHTALPIGVFLRDQSSGSAPLNMVPPSQTPLFSFPLNNKISAPPYLQSPAVTAPQPPKPLHLRDTIIKETIRISYACLSASVLRKQARGFLIVPAFQMRKQKTGC